MNVFNTPSVPKALELHYNSSFQRSLVSEYREIGRACVTKNIFFTGVKIKIKLLQVKFLMFMQFSKSYKRVVILRYFSFYNFKRLPFCRY